MYTQDYAYSAAVLVLLYIHIFRTAVLRMNIYTIYAPLYMRRLLVQQLRRITCTAAVQMIKNEMPSLARSERQRLPRPSAHTTNIIMNNSMLQPIKTPAHASTDYGIPYTTLYITPPWADYPWSIPPQQENCRRQKGRRWKHLVDSFPKTQRSVMAPSLLSSNRAWKAAPAVCNIYFVL